MSDPLFDWLVLLTPRATLNKNRWWRQPPRLSFSKEPKASGWTPLFFFKTFPSFFPSYILSFLLLSFHPLNTLHLPNPTFSKQDPPRSVRPLVSPVRPSVLYLVQLSSIKPRKYNCHLRHGHSIPHIHGPYHHPSTTKQSQSGNTRHLTSNQQ
ncbi:hypothetical protein K457DRAFT_225310 [Linnemannia elongata AG-77]|uniref:Uncharacterized protein n=1 Tax=Linnemannia elongata AG-77 TaxID=1314771 RepID=A0A197K7H6_9FUNG|nr:hypothetical protein K457DRAFT_225310 [Linnemannia elongata AG-77]